MSVFSLFLTADCESALGPAKQVQKAYVLLAHAERMRGRGREAVETLLEGRRHHPKNPELLYTLGTHLHEAGRLDDAESCFETILKTSAWPQEFGSFDVGILGYKSKHRLAMVRFDKGQSEETEVLLQEVLRESPDYSPATRDLAMVFVERERRDLAEPLLMSLSAQGRKCDALFLNGRLKIKEKRLEEGLSLLEEALRLQPENEDVLSEIAHVSLVIGQVDEAERYLRRQLGVNPASAQAHYNLAGLLFGSDRFREALESVEAALSSQRDHELSVGLREKILERLSWSEKQTDQEKRETPVEE